MEAECTVYILFILISGIIYFNKWCVYCCLCLAAILYIQYCAKVLSYTLFLYIFL